MSTSNFLSTHTSAQHTSAHASSVQIRNWPENCSNTWIHGVGLVISDPEDSKHLGIEARKTLCCSCLWEVEFEMAANYTSDGDTCKECLLWFFFLRNGDLVVRKLLFLPNHASHLLIPAVCMLLFLLSRASLYPCTLYKLSLISLSILSSLPATVDLTQWQYQFRIIMLGDSTVGKSSLVKRYTEDLFLESINQTVGVDFYVHFIEVEPGVRVKLQFWDTAGQERFR